jgi:predicted  nucleic acid-binding Zn-ribbon protein
MREQIKTLVALQRIESESAALSADMAAVPGRLAILDAELKGFQADISARESAFEEQKKKYRSQELEVQNIQSAIRSSQAKLTAVKTNKEYQALLKEIEERKVKSSALEDDMLDFLEHMDQTEDEIAAQRSVCRQQAADIESRKSDLRMEAEQKRLRLEALRRERKQITARLDPALLKQFSHVMAAHPDRVAVASVTHGVCSGCNMNIPPQMYNELQKCDSIRLCPSCERIIYWVEA